MDKTMVLSARAVDPEYFREVNGCYVFYHVTDVSNMEYILETGLRSCVGPRSTKQHVDGGVYVFLSEDGAEDIRDSWLGDEIKADHEEEFGDAFSGYVVFELHVPVDFVMAYGVYDVIYGHELLFTRDVPKEYIRTFVYDDVPGSDVRFRKAVMYPITRDVIRDAREKDPAYFTEVNGCYVFYHVTDGVHMDSVLENGLYSRVGSRSTEMFEEPGVFVFLSESDSDDGIGNWLGDLLDEAHEELYGEELEEFARFEIHVPIDFVMEHGRYNSEVGYELMFTSAIPKEFIVRGEYV